MPLGPRAPTPSGPTMSAGSEIPDEDSDTVTMMTTMTSSRMTTLVLFGRPASGKGTLGQHLTHARGYLACSTGQAMREWAAGPSPEQVALRATMAAGGYGSDELAVRIVREFIAAVPPEVPGVILDGFPRDRAQLDAWFASSADPGIAIVVDTPEAVCRERVLGRMVCMACGWTDHHPATTCDRCGEPLKRRMDDGDAATFERRLGDYDKRVAPLIDTWVAAGLPMLRLDGTLGVPELARDVVVGLDKLGVVAGTSK
jgi:adenylate kinase